MSKIPKSAILLAGVLLSGAAIWVVAQLLAQSWQEPTVPTCDGRLMSIVETCDSYRNGHKSSSTDYKSQLAADVFGHYLGLYAVAAGIVTLGVVGVSVVWTMTTDARRRNQHHEPPSE